MKVRISITVEVDPIAWQKIYGCNPKDTKKDIKNYIVNSILESQPDGLIKRSAAALKAWDTMRGGKAVQS